MSISDLVLQIMILKRYQNCKIIRNNQIFSIKYMRYIFKNLNELVK